MPTHERIKYKCGCYASGDNVSLWCPVHGLSGEFINVEAINSYFEQINKCQSCYELQQRLATAESQYDELSRQNNALKNTVKLFYRKHCLNDDSIGWDELGDNLYNALAKTLGDKEFCKWLDTQSM